MKISKALVLSLGVSLSSVSFANSAEVVEARALAKQFMGQLKPALGAAMKSGGPVHAISVCKDKAPAIAQNLSESSGWDLKRVSLKNRSPIAEPDAWETKVLNQFEQQRADGMKPGKIEYSEVVQENGQKNVSLYESDWDWQRATLFALSRHESKRRRKAKVARTLSKR